MKKTVIIIISAVIVLCVAVAGVTVFFSDTIAQKRAMTAIKNARYGDAADILTGIDSDYAVALLDYCNLRIAIKKQFPSLLAEYDPEAVSSLYNSAVSIYESGHISDKSINEYLLSIQASTLRILNADSDYSVIADDVVSLLGVFSEYNRLHIQVNGKNEVFTLAEEYAKLDEWQRNLNNVVAYASIIPEYESVYLLSYLIKEARNEIIQLQSEMDSVSAEGYGDTESVHYNGNTARNFPEINNGNGVVVGFRNKSVFIKYLRAGIRSQLVSTQLESLYYSE